MSERLKRQALAVIKNEVRLMGNAMQRWYRRGHLKAPKKPNVLDMIEEARENESAALINEVAMMNVEYVKLENDRVSFVYEKGGKTGVTSVSIKNLSGNDVEAPCYVVERTMVG